jgi:hypothetical protein
LGGQFQSGGKANDAPAYNDYIVRVVCHVLYAYFEFSVHGLTNAVKAQ